MTKLILKKDDVLSKLVGIPQLESKFSARKNQIKIGKVVLDLSTGTGYIGQNIVLKTFENKVVLSSYVYGSFRQGKSTMNLLLKKLGIKPDLVVNARYGLNRLDDSLFEIKSQITMIDAELATIKTGSKYESLCEKRAVLAEDVSNLKKVKELMSKSSEQDFLKVQVEQNEKHEENKSKKLKEIAQKEKVASLFLKVRRYAENQFALNKANCKSAEMVLHVNDSHVDNHSQAKYFQSYNFNVTSQPAKNWFFQVSTGEFEVLSYLNGLDMIITVKTAKGEISFPHVSLFAQVYESLKKSKLVEVSEFESLLKAIELLKVTSQVWFLRQTSIINKDIRSKQQEMETLRANIHLPEEYAKFKTCSMELAKFFCEIQNCRALQNLFSDSDMVKIKSLLGL